MKNDTNERADVFVHDRRSKKTKRVSARTDGGQAIGGGSSDHDISANGRFVVFSSFAGNVVGNDDNTETDIFVRDRKKQKTKLISRKSNGALRAGASEDPSLSADGRYVAFKSAASLVSNDNNATEIFMRGPLR